LKYRALQQRQAEETFHSIVVPFNMAGIPTERIFPQYCRSRDLGLFQFPACKRFCGFSNMADLV